MAAATAALGIAACGGDDGDGGSTTADFPRACDESEIDGDCVLFTGDGWTAEDVGSACDNGGSVSALCPPAPQVGQCTLNAGELDETVTAFYTPFWSATQAGGQCEGSGGVWVGAR